jgi:hypothetical protein
VFAVSFDGFCRILRQLLLQRSICHGRFEFPAHRAGGAGQRAGADDAWRPPTHCGSPSGFTAITQSDRALLKEFAEANLIPDWLALSLIASPQDVRDSRSEARKILGAEVRIMAKFETVAAVECAEAIIEVSEGVMVARGDCSRSAARCAGNRGTGCPAARAGLQRLAVSSSKNISADVSPH